MQRRALETECPAAWRRRRATLLSTPPLRGTVAGEVMVTEKRMATVAAARMRRLGVKVRGG
ncbi:hypothetical protein F2Q69_00029870 [Brassica cretica]|uniref:Uncharacterized protein n=1 Tax=Brassica cretica TaxID=69181 RepID=A0A8S9S7M9_BRACR|nr:hypothetical protein F2Q69_00029870 [Brassica cretica]